MLDAPRLDLTAAQFGRISALLYLVCGIALRPGKEALVKARLSRRLRDLGLANLEDYLAYLESDTGGDELTHLVDALTTNQTSFFREAAHFTFLAERMIPQLGHRQGPIRLWSAGCSSGEEAYSLAITLREHLPNVDGRDVRVLATDVSTQVLATARAATYDEAALHGVSPHLVARYFGCVRREPPRQYQVVETVRAMVVPARLNLLHTWPMRGPFDAIFCRNVLIYFDDQARYALVERFWQLLHPGGYLFVGHAESLTPHAFGYVQPAVYVKAAASLAPAADEQ